MSDRIAYSIGTYRGPLPKEPSSWIPVADYTSLPVTEEIGKIESFGYLTFVTHKQSKKHFRETMRPPALVVWTTYIARKFE